MLCAGLPPRIYESLKTLCCLANAVGPLQAYEIASAADLPPAQTAKILQLMTWAGFIESRRGTKGGFWLVTPADHIRVTDVADFFTHHAKGNLRELFLAAGSSLSQSLQQWISFLPGYRRSHGGETTHHLFALSRTLRIRQAFGLSFSTDYSISPRPTIEDYC
jgi:hypothetical protein